jgi:prophage regulatory protein
LKLIPFDQLRPQKGIGYCRDHLRRKVRSGEFPKPISLSNRRIAWREDEIDEWLATRPRPGHCPTKDLGGFDEKPESTSFSAAERNREDRAPIGQTDLDHTSN